MASDQRNDTPYKAGAADDATISLLDLIAVVARRKWLIIGITVAAAAVILVLLALSIKLPVTSKLNFFPDKYKPTASILLQSPSQSGSLSSLLGNNNSTGLGSLSSLLGGSSTLGGTSADLVGALLKSNSILDRVATEFDIAGRMHFTKQPKARSRAFLIGGIRTKVDIPSGIMQIGFENTDKEFATNVVNSLVDLVGSEFTRLSVSKILDKEKYLADQLASSEAEAGRLQANLLEFQSKSGIYSPTEQVTANLQTIAELQARITQAQIDLNSQSKYLPETDYHIVQLKDQITETQNAISNLIRGTSKTTSGAVPQNQLAALSAQYENLLRDVTVQEAIVSTVKSQYEAARIDELSTQQAFQVVDRAEVPEARSAPSRAKTAVIVTIAAALVAVLLAFVLEYFSRAKDDPVEAGKLKLIRESFSLQRRHKEQ